MTVAHFGFTKLVVHDLDRQAGFYGTVFGLTEMARVSAAVNERAIDEIIYQPTATGGATFVLWKWRDRDDAPGDGVILGFQVESADATVAGAIAAGGTIVETPRDQPDYGVRVGFVADPEGNLIEIVQITGAWAAQQPG
ncbi:VOC family protein [Sphingomonas sp. RP10(2022)]|uniref:VOC family protein n=1 Tax=Sphingomonas liriopis TaxID=2949094 RepID=A0A9X2HM30_9SPHN|nr:VOC family protein [Sphingomonas liriopis]MCP3733478.1 VOC family protein [Sphingomonas liriopis]